MHRTRNARRALPGGVAWRRLVPTSERPPGLALKDLLRFVREQNCVAIKGEEPKQVIPSALGLRGQERRSSHPGGQSMPHILGDGGQEEVAAEGLHIAIGALPATKSCPLDGESVMLDRVKHPKPRICRVPR